MSQCFFKDNQDFDKWLKIYQILMIYNYELKDVFSIIIERFGYCKICGSDNIDGRSIWEQDDEGNNYSNNAVWYCVNCSTILHET